jgi:hypothetical protein
MAGYVQNGKAQAAVVSVAPTLTVIMQPSPCDVQTILTAERTNNDGTQSLNEQIEGAPSMAGPWSVLQAQDLQRIAPGEFRIRSIPINGYRALRTTGKASGAGLSVTATTTLYTRP